MRQNTRNPDIKEYAKQKDVRLWMVAEVLHLTDAALSVYLRKVLTDPEKQRLMSIIDDLAKGE